MSTSAFVAVWRVEDADDCRGPYNTTAADIANHEHRLEFPDGPVVSVHENPTPVNDPGMSMQWDALPFGDARSVYSFGFASLQSYRDWFSSPAHRRGLHKAGAVLRRYRVRDTAVMRGNAQVAFLKMGSTVLDTRSCVLA